MMAELIFDLHLTKEEFLLWYEGGANRVFVHARNGKGISFPANILRPYVSHIGVRGTFVIAFDEHNKFKSIRRISD